MLIKFLALCKKEFLYMAVGAGGVFLLMEAIIMGVMVFIQPDRAGQAADIALSSTATIVMVCVGASFIIKQFAMGLQMGMPRRAMLGFTLGTLTLMALLSWGLVRLLVWVEASLLVPLWRNASPGMWVSEFVGLSWWFLPVTLLSALLVGVAVGTIFLHFGARVGGIVIVSLWFGFLFSQAGLETLFLRLEFYELWSIIKDALPIVAVVTAVGLLIWTIWTLLHLSVRE